MNPQQARRELRRREGLCIDCKKPAEPGLTRCLNHLEENARAARKYWATRKARKA